MKNARQQKILELIEKYDIDTQETLIERLSEAGFVVTQTTVSRDIKQLSLVKGVTGRGTYKYVSPGVKSTSSAPVLNSAITESIIHIEAAENIIVIKTLSGMANAVGVCIDSLNVSGVIGSVAGDDTILLVAKSSEVAKGVEAELKQDFGLGN
jgi:transcriptional regulator of arginine metabolism